MRRVCFAFGIALCSVLLILAWMASTSNSALAEAAAIEDTPYATQHMLVAQGAPPTVVTLENGYRVRIVETTKDSFCIDTPEDLEKLLASGRV